MKKCEQGCSRTADTDIGALTMVTVLHHVNVTVPAELEETTKAFYGSVLGLQQIPKPAAARQTGAWYQIGDNQLHLSVDDEAQGP